MAPRPLRLFAATAAAIGVVLPTTAEAAVQPARSSAAFVDSIGVNVHSAFANTPYDDHARVLATLKDLGVRHVRDGLFTPTGAPTVIARQKAFRASLANAGIKSLLIMGSPGENPAAYVAGVRDEGSTTLDGIEGPNEWDLSGHTNWASEVRDYQQRLYAAAKAEPRLNDVPVLGPSLAYLDRVSQLGNVGASTDRANIHAYPGGRAPGTFDDGIQSYANAVSGGEPAVVTETGYHNAMWQPGGHAPTSEAAVATYMPRLFLDNFRRGIPRTYSYELINAHDDPVKMSANYNFGLLRNDWSAKPVYGTLKSLIRLVDAQPADAPAGSLDYTLSGDTTGVQQVLLRRNDGSFALVLWQTAPVWDAYGRRDLYPGAKSVKVTLAAPADVSTGRPKAGSSLTPVVSSSTSAGLSVPGDDALVVVIRPTGAAAPPPTTGSTDAVVTPPPTTTTPTETPAPAPAPAPAPTVTRTPSLQEQWQQALRNLKRRLGLRTAANAKAKAKKTASKKRKSAKSARR